MSLLPVGIGSSGGYTIDRSVRLRSSASASLTRTFTTPTDGKKWTFSAWVKMGVNNSIGIQANNGTAATWIGIGTSGITVTRGVVGVIITWNAVTAAVYRDPSAWYHATWVYDSTQATASNRIKTYVNGVLQVQTGSFPSLNEVAEFNSAYLHTMMNGNVFGALDGYLTEINFIDGQALDASSFGETDADTGVWKAKKYVGTYGTNGFYLNFSDNTSTTTLGYDYSGNSNNWTANNISLTAGATYDSMTDVPTMWADGGNGRGNYCVMNPLMSAGASFANGNLQVTHSAATSGSIASFELPTSGKWYWESTITQLGSSCGIGILRMTDVFLLGSGAGYGQTGGSYTYREDGTKRNNASGSAYGASYTTNDVIGIAYDADNNTLTFYKNNTSQGTAWSGLTEKPYIPVFGASVGTANIQAVNFGQRPFSYTPPTGFKALNTFNLPDSTIVDGSQYFDAVLWTGDGTGDKAITGVGFQPDFVWVKSRSDASSHRLSDVVRGSNGVLFSNLTNAEAVNSASGYINSFDSDGFSTVAGATNNNNYNNTSISYVAWNWKAGGTAVSNTDGTITSSVSANTTSGFSIVTYTGTGSNATVGHGLGVAPKMVIVKDRDTAGNNWFVWHTALTGLEYLILNLTNAKGSASAKWNSTIPSSTVFSVGTDSEVNGLNHKNVAYCFADVPGFSKFGSYTGNGSADGPFVFTNFRPKWLMYKRTDVVNSWVVLDSSRSTYNVTDDALIPNLSDAEYANEATLAVDFLSNGFKVRTTGTAANANGGTYIYAAFAENPTKLALAR